MWEAIGLTAVKYETLLNGCLSVVSIFFLYYYLHGSALEVLTSLYCLRVEIKQNGAPPTHTKFRYFFFQFLVWLYVVFRLPYIFFYPVGSPPPLEHCK